MEKSLSNELFVVGVSLDCLAVGCPENSPIANRLQALSGQVLSDSQKVGDLEDKYESLRKDWNFLAARIFEVCNNDSEDCEHEELIKSVLGSKFVEMLKNYV